MTATLEYLSDLVRRYSGIQIPEEKFYLFDNRLHPVLKKHALPALEDLAVRLRGNPSGPLFSDLIDAMTTNETYFFRDKKPFDELANAILPMLPARATATGTLRIWSAACATGQEAYSTAMLLSEDGWVDRGGRVEILATDISGHALQRGMDAVYSTHEVQRGLPAEYLGKYFEPIHGDWRIQAALRQMVRFEKLNLLEPVFGIGRFDVIFCRNVLIYFDVPTKMQILKQLHRHLAPGGVFSLGGAETPIGLTDLYEPAIPGGFWWRARSASQA